MPDILNPHRSTVYHDPASRDFNKYENLNTREKAVKIDEYCKKWVGQAFHVIQIQTGEVRHWHFPWNVQRNGCTRHARTNVVHLLFGNWRVATEAEIKKSDAENLVKSDHIALVEARKAAKKAGLIDRDLQNASQAVNTFNALHEKVAANDTTLIEMKAMLEQIRTERAALAEEKKSQQKGK